MSHAPQPKLPKHNDVHSDPNPAGPPRVSKNLNEWVKERRKLLVAEKDALRAYDAMIKQRRQLPWVRLESGYVFEDLVPAKSVKVPLLSLFQVKEQEKEGDEKKRKLGTKSTKKKEEDDVEYLPLVIQHFMWPEGWDKACGNCSIWADGISGLEAQLSTRASFAIVATPPKDLPVKTWRSFIKTKGWSNIPFLSCRGTTFGTDFGVSQPQADIDAGKPLAYNFTEGKANPFGCTELPGFSVFVRKGNNVYRTYSCFARGVEPLCSYFTILDILPTGRQGQFGIPHKEDVLEERAAKRKRLEKN